jgi:hypothetical protein
MKSILSVNFVEERCGYTVASLAGIYADTGWLGLEKTVASWGADLTALTQLSAQAGQARLRGRVAANSWSLHSAYVQARTRDVAASGRIRFRKNADGAALFASLRTDAKNRPAVLAQALAARDAWKQIDAGWSIDEDFTLPIFTDEIAALSGLQSFHSEQQTTAKAAMNTLMNKAREVDDDCVAWYELAARRFPEGTTQGDALRSTVPTTYRPAKNIGATTLSVTALGDGVARTAISAEGATRFSLWRRGPDTAQWLLLTDKAKSGTTDWRDLPPGEHAFKAQGRNSRRKGEECAPVSVVIAARTAA